MFSEHILVRCKDIFCSSKVKEDASTPFGLRWVQQYLTPDVIVFGNENETIGVFIYTQLSNKIF